MDDLAHGRVASFGVIAHREGKGERHIRLLAPLAFLSPRIVSTILDGTAPAYLTVTTLARVLPYSWAEQESRVATSRSFSELKLTRRSVASNNRVSRTSRRYPPV
jgi:site-specific DNA recombinase